MIKYKTFTLIIHTDSKEEVDRLFDELSQDGQIKVPVGLTFWGAYYGQCIDKFGISWKITLASENQSEPSMNEEIGNRFKLDYVYNLVCVENQQFVVLAN